MKQNLALTPPMGWNSWNTFGGEVTEADIKSAADGLVETGLRDVGYEYVVIDDQWEAEERVDGKLTWNPEKFPGGISALADYVHERGLKFGIYTCAGTHTCGGKPASFRYEDVDAKTFAEWGVDFVKVDFCFHPPGASGPESYRRMGQALRTCGRDIVYSICNWGFDDLPRWARGVGGHLWRTYGDIKDKWSSILEIGFRKQRGLEPYAGPGGWNDPDMLVVGMRGQGKNLEVLGLEEGAGADAGVLKAEGEAGCTNDEYTTHFALWCLLAAPLMIGADIRRLDDFSLNLLRHRELIAINQDPLGVQGRLLGDAHRGVEVWAKPLADGSVAVGFFNLGKHPQWKAPVSWESLGLPDLQECRVSDVITGESLGVWTRSYASRGVPSHGCEIVRIAPV